MNTFNKSVVVLIFAAVVLCGCSCGFDVTRTGYPTRTEYIESGRPIKVAQVSGIERGETTQTQIIEWFGAPTKRAATDDDIAYTYLHCKKISSATYAHSAKKTCAVLFIVFDRATSTVSDFEYAPKLLEGRLTKLSLKGSGAMW